MRYATETGLFGCRCRPKIYLTKFGAGNLLKANAKGIGKDRSTISLNRMKVKYESASLFNAIALLKCLSRILTDLELRANRAAANQAGHSSGRAISTDLVLRIAIRMCSKLLMRIDRRITVYGSVN